MSIANTMSKDYIHNPIKVLHRLIDAGFTQKQAEVQVEVLTDYIDNNVASKRDIFDLKKDITELKSELKRDIKELELRLTIRLSSIVGLIVGFFYSLDKFF